MPPALLRLLAVLSLFLALPASFAAGETPVRAAPEPYDAVVLRVQDGDSVIARRIGQTRTHRLRISGIDAPERGQAYAEASRAALKALVEGERVRVTPSRKDPWDRVVATLRLGEHDVGLAMIEGGHAWYFRRYRRDLPAELRKPYERAEARAREAGIGLWSDRDAQAPWDYRLRQRDQRDAATRERLSPS
jgi:endonuclease YncB( thermonuclease family)